jgi:hypothetical protein
LIFSHSRGTVSKFVKKINSENFLKSLG